MSKKLTLNEMIKRAKQIHGDDYDYSFCKNNGLYKKNKMKCNKCGNIFEMTFSAHINQKQGCRFCSHRSYKYTMEEFLERAKKVHGNKYDYSKVEYVNSRTKVCIVCPEHGEFWQTPYKHVNSKQGCPKCAKNCRLNTDGFIKKAKEIHGNEYDYSKVHYEHNEKKVCIICPEHGEFLQTPHAHLSGQGCPNCNCEKNVNEIKLFNFLKKNLNCEIISQYKSEWLKGQTLDIFIPDYKIAIEYQGIQHFTPVNYFGGTKKYEYTIKMDRLKNEKCRENGIKLFYFSKEKNAPKEYLHTIYSNNNEILDEIIKYGNDRRFN